MISRKNSIDDSYVIHDYCQLNDNIVKDHTSISCQDKTIEMIARAKVREKLDLLEAYYQI